MIPSARTRAVVDPGAFSRNIDRARRLAGNTAGLMAVMKADAYGHGARILAPAARRSGCSWIGVATVEEGLDLRESGDTGRILVLGGVPEGSERQALEAKLTPVLFAAEDARRLDRAAAAQSRRFPVHLKLDSGMGRLGVFPEDLPTFLETVLACPALFVEGFMTHYSRADEANGTYTAGQTAVFDRAVALLASAGVRPAFIHAANSATLISGRGPLYGLVRPGIMLYGELSPLMADPASLGLEAVLTLLSTVVQVRDMPHGRPVSYGGRWTTDGNRRLAVVGIGYADGFLRYNEGGHMLVRGQRAPVAGAVCMDMTMIDVTGIDGVQAGDEVVVIGRQGGERISAGQVARRGETISYEVLCGIGPRVPRLPSREPADPGDGGRGR